ncbi:MAG: deoxyribose-phosphate aldolase [Bacteroidota bacterium]|nr:deoxyribose-phosphate aldolase [Kiloniellaceae bacterium]
MADGPQALKAVAERAIRLLDLTSLGDDDGEATVTALCERALAAPIPVAAVCLWPKFVAQAAAMLDGSGIRVAAVANFPAGDDDLGRAVREAEFIVKEGGDEVDLVMPYRRWLDGDVDAACGMIAACKDACGEAALLKVILETGRLREPAQIYAASRDAIEAGADFVKTSTGKIEVSATLAAAEAMLRAIRDSGRDVGFKAAGGIRDTAAAGDYLALADRMMGSDWADARHFRFGASGLLDDLVARLAGAGGKAGPAGSY